MSKKEILSYIDQVNFNTKRFLGQDYENFKKYISSPTWPRLVDYLNNDYAPDLIKFMQSRVGGRKAASYYGFLKAIGEKDLPAFNERQEEFVRYVSEMLPLVRPYEYLILQKLVMCAGKADLDEILRYVQTNASIFSPEAYAHALHYMLATDFFVKAEDKSSISLVMDRVKLDVEMDEYLQDLLEYGLGKYEVDFADAVPEETFHLWAKYRKEQVQLLLLNNPKDIMVGTKIYNGIVYAYVTVIKASSTKDDLKYVDGYIDENTFQWETVANVRDRELNALKSSKKMHIFVRKVDNEDGIQLPFTYIGSGHMEYVEGSKKPNGAHLFHIPMEVTAPEDLYFDFKLPN